MSYTVAIKAKRAYETKGAKQAVQNFDNVYGAYLGAWENYINATVDMNAKQKKVWESDNGFRDADGKFIENDKERFIAKWAVKEGAERIKKIMLAENKTTIASAYNARDFDKVKDTSAPSKPTGKPAGKPASAGEGDNGETLAKVDSPTLAIVSAYATSDKVGKLDAIEIAQLLTALKSTLAKENDVKIAGIDMAMQSGIKKTA